MARNEPSQQPSSSGSNGTSSSTSNGSAKPSKITVKIVNASFTKPCDCYVEIMSDAPSAAPKKTAVKKKTSAPEWNESVNVHANNESTLTFRVFQKAKLFEDTCQGMAKVKLTSVPRNDNGEFKTDVMNVNLLGKDSSKVGTINLIFTGYAERKRRSAGGQRTVDAAAAAGSEASTSNGVAPPRTASGRRPATAKRDTLTVPAVRINFGV
ncbi:hypothetical protein L3Y34_014088 [Caenorhabditis briggsae]|uniref:C2 domain-containing protein n=1 Tax=Caenorhabditis briggsae TaxID=6238 RepID=A0AAE9DRY1_CAEBR|nr:hypothetical protein L3Y34_014088 [Caenorhabditis briggsae]